MPKGVKKVKFVPTDEQRESVRVMKAGGMSHGSIASVIGISDTTLEKVFRRELDTGKASVDARILNTLAKLAGSGECPAATFFYLKTRCGFRENTGITHDGSVSLTGPKEELLSRLAASVTARTADEGDSQAQRPASNGAVDHLARVLGKT